MFCANKITLLFFFFLWWFDFVISWWWEWLIKKVIDTQFIYVYIYIYKFILYLSATKFFNIMHDFRGPPVHDVCKLKLDFQSCICDMIWMIDWYYHMCRYLTFSSPTLKLIIRNCLSQPSTPYGLPHVSKSATPSIDTK